MPDGTGVEMVGLAEANAAIKQWANSQLPLDFIIGTRSFADSVATEVAARVPVLTGALAGSVVGVSDDKSSGVGMGNDDDVPYARWIEFGGSRGRDLVPQGRYVYPTIQSAMSQLADAAGTTAKTSIAKYPWPSPSPA
jgi:hypothetical protein